MFFFIVTSIQSFPIDDKTPTMETFSPISEKPKISVATIPPPRLSDFVVSDVDPYSEQCSELLDNLEFLEEDGNNEIVDKPKSASLKLKPLELKEHNIEVAKTQQPKLTTPGKF